MTPLKRAAAVIAEQMGTEEGDGIAIVRLVLLAIREPSEGMILANSEAGWPDDAQTIADWQAMIDAALAE